MFRVGDRVIALAEDPKTGIENPYRITSAGFVGVVKEVIDENFIRANVLMPGWRATAGIRINPQEYFDVETKYFELHILNKGKGLD